MKKNWFLTMLDSYDYQGVTSFAQSVAPSFRYSLTKCLVLLSGTYSGSVAIGALFFPVIEKIFGISGGAFIMLILAFVVELFSGLVASHIRKDQISSFKLSRFSLKVFIYIVLIAIPFQWKQSYAAHHDDFMECLFGWLQDFLIMQIALENVVSILENLAVITGKDKTAWINKIQDFLSNNLPSIKQ